MVVGISKGTERKRQHPDVEPSMRKYRAVSGCSGVGSLPSASAGAKATKIHEGRNASSHVEERNK
jgi:hypothetical protein